MKRNSYFVGYFDANPTGREVQGVGMRPLAC